MQATFELDKADSDVSTDKVTVTLKCPGGDIACDVKWSAKVATCKFKSTVMGEHTVCNSYLTLQKTRKCVYETLYPSPMPLRLLASREVHPIKYIRRGYNSFQYLEFLAKAVLQIILFTRFFLYKMRMSENGQ